MSQPIWPLNRHREVWDSSIPPGGMVCNYPDEDGVDGRCGRPVEDEPCAEHNPDDTAPASQEGGNRG